MKIEMLACGLENVDSSMVRNNYLKSVVGLSDSEVKKLEETIWKGNNVLLKLYLLRYNETIRLFPVKDISLEDINFVRTSSQSREPPCTPLQQLWRDNCRDWMCHVYAYAVPNQCSLDIFKDLNGTIIEIGAGTGYWGSLLSKTMNDHSMYLYDSHPLSTVPQPEESKASRKTNIIQNEYHGKTLAFTGIKKGGFTELKVLTSQDTDSILVLCYPPPGCPMALNCLQNFNGKYIVYIGEWQGDTGSYDFEKALYNEFYLIRMIGLPNWNNTCFSLSVWERGNDKGMELTPKNNLCDLLSSGNLPLCCISCGKTGCSLKRCICCAQVSYCSRECSTAHSTIHSQLHRFYQFHLSSLPHWDNKQHYQRLKLPFTK